MTAVQFLALALATLPAAEPDPFAAHQGGTTSAMIRAAEFGEPGADRHIVAWLIAHSKVPAVSRRRLMHRLCIDYLQQGAYHLAEGACGKSTKLGADDADAARIGAQLRDLPPIRATGSGRLPLIPNALGSRDATVTVNGYAKPWIVDTGAEITVVSQGLADHIGLKPLDGTIQTGSTTGAVQGRLALNSRLYLGDRFAENVPVMILPDASLNMGGLAKVEAVLGLPVLKSFGRVAWIDHGAILALGDSAPELSASTPRLYWHQEGLGAPISTARGVKGAHLDTGANTSELRSAGKALLNPDQERSAIVVASQLGGAGGVENVRRLVYPNVTIEVAGAPVTLSNVALDQQDSQGAARLGNDVVEALSLLVLDFRHMRVLARP